MTTFKKGNLVGILQHTMVEMPTKFGYKWKQQLALLSDDGKWLVTESWRGNATKKAQNALEQMGWKLQK